MQRKPLADKILILGMDGMDPRLTKKMVEKGLMPNVKKYIERGSCREDLVMLGGHPTVTPPMWTTLGTGCYANVHGITGYYNQKENSLDTIIYSMDSRLCQAEYLWDVFAENGKKTLVWHWPGASWPPSSDSENLFVVDGTSPGAVGMAALTVDDEFFIGANTEFKEVAYRPTCVSAAMDVCETENLVSRQYDICGLGTGSDIKRLLMRKDQTCIFESDLCQGASQSPIKEAEGWEKVPAGAKEFTILFSQGLVRYPALILRNSEGFYDKVAIYKNKKEAEPFVVLEKGIMMCGILTDAIIDEKHFRVARSLRLLHLSEDGSKLAIYSSNAMDLDNDSVFSPKRLHREILDNVGAPRPTPYLGCQDKMKITDCQLDGWSAAADWQSKALHHVIETEQLEIVFSHFHAIDLQAHMFYKHLSSEFEGNIHPHEVYEKFQEDMYVQADNYLGSFLHFLDEGWTIFIVSDHGSVVSKHEQIYLGELAGVNVPVMKELGFTVLKKDENGNELPEIDWAKTRAVAIREHHIYINLKGRDPEGIVDPADKYELEEEIMTALYGYLHPKTGYRAVSVALRNRDAVLLGLGGPRCGDICFWMTEGSNYEHGDCLSTTYGLCDTSVSPIFIAAGPGLKEGFKTERIIREVDLVPTMAVVGGMRMPAQCEGAPVYQIIDGLCEL